MSKRANTRARWTSALKKLKAISLRQPWAWLVVNGYKDIENRRWPTNIRGLILIHAGTKRPKAERLKGFLEVWPEAVLEYGGIVGVVKIADCTQKHRSKWFNGPYGWVLKNPRPLPFRKCTGKLKFFVPDI